MRTIGQEETPDVDETFINQADGLTYKAVRGNRCDKCALNEETSTEKCAAGPDCIKGGDLLVFEVAV